MLAAQLFRAQPSLVLLQNAYDLLFAEPASFHRLSPQLENRLTSKRGHFRGARQSENNGMPNSSFAAKKPFFEKSSLTTTAALGEYEGWSPKEVEDRQKEMATLALRAWPAE
ncbi:HNH endonuclease family protein [Leisingera caerulea]|uniref:HNH endonuclease family protein n=1 Tax=Leisingera caerulea TaxID=506591 RepID=UPI003908948E